MYVHPVMYEIAWKVPTDLCNIYDNNNNNNNNNVCLSTYIIW
jgi:hypothetical protein